MGCLCQSGFWCVSRVLGCPVCPAELTHNDQGAKDALKEMEKRYFNSKRKFDEMKQRVQSLVEGVVKTARKQEQKMLDEIKATYDRNEVIFETVQSRTAKLCEDASNRIKSAQVIIQNGGLEVVRVIKDTLAETLKKLSKSLNISVLEANGKFTQSLELSLTNTDLAEEFIDDEFSLGKLNVNNGQVATPQDTTIAFAAPSWEASMPKKAVFISKLKDYSRCGSLIQPIGSTSHFDAFSVAASRDCGVIVVLDDDAKFVHTFTEAGKKLNKFHIKDGDLWDIVVSNEDEIVVLSRDKNCLLHYDMNGNFQKKIVSASKENVKFTSCTVDVHGRFIITSYPYCKDEKGNDAMRCVLVYRPSGKLTMSFGEEHLGCPEKAVFLNGRFYVIDSHCGARVKVFDKTGSLIKTFEDEQLKSPSAIAADHISGILAVTDTDTLTVHIYNQAGQRLHRFETENKPTDIAFTKNFKSLLVCFEVDDGNGYVEMLTYR